MKLTVKHGALLNERAEMTVLGLFDTQEMDATTRGFDKALGGTIARIIKGGDFRPEPNKTLLLPTYGRLSPERLLLVGLGREDDFSPERARQAAGSALKAARKLGVGTVTSQLFLGRNPVEQAAQAMAEGAVLGLYRFKRFKHLKPEEAAEVNSLTIIAEDRAYLQGAREGVRRGQLVAEAVCHARDLINLPGSEATPSMLAEEARKMGRQFGFSVKVLNEDAIKRLGMNGLLSVSRGSVQPPRFIILQYGRRRQGQDTVVLAGKGVTFDTGGISLKPWQDMDKMKYDMAGAASVLCAFGVLARLGPRVHLVGLLPCAENMPGARAVKPGDIVTCMGGKTVEIVTTDAEGRLLLADALVYARRYRPAAVVDLATLTGACVVALGNLAIGMLGNNEVLKERIKAAGEATHERVWEMPLWEEYGELIKSDVADMKNVGDRSAGVITGAKFLENFVDKFPWVHLDIAGAAWSGKDGPYVAKGASGAGVRLLVELIMNWEKMPAEETKK